jgi:hypothetical protein
MKHIAALNEDKVPRNAEYNFLGRAQALVHRWSSDIVNPNKPKNAAEEKTEGGEGTEVNMGAVGMDVGGSSAVANGNV